MIFELCASTLWQKVCYNLTHRAAQARRIYRPT